MTNRPETRPIDYAAARRRAGEERSRALAELFAPLPRAVRGLFRHRPAAPPRLG
jgi:hypothetical protein